MIAVTTYLIYLSLSVSMTIWVANSLSKGGAVFLRESFGGKKELANSINHLLVVGFYLLNLGYICITLDSGRKINNLDLVSAIELLANKMGYVILFLGIFHMLNIFIFSKYRSSALVNNQEKEQISKFEQSIVNPI